VRALEQNPVAVLTPDAIHAHVVTGLGGVGKTQLALDYAEHHWATRQVDLLVWVTAGSRESIVSSYARLAADLTGIDDPNPEHGAHRLLEWPADTPTRWLVVLDDLQHPVARRSGGSIKASIPPGRATTS
jgi:hypothetical protein